MPGSAGKISVSTGVSRRRRSAIVVSLRALPLAILLASCSIDYKGATVEEQAPSGLGARGGGIRGGHAAASPETRTRVSSRAWAAPLSIAVAASSIPAAMVVARSAA